MTIKDDKVLVGLITVFVVGLLGSNLLGITGNFSLTNNSQVPIVSSSQGVIKAGEKIDINIQVRGACVDPKVKFYFTGTKYDGRDFSNKVFEEQVVHNGRYKYCQGDYGLDKNNGLTVSYRTRPDWDGEYHARVYYWVDRTTKDYVDTYFKVQPKSKR
jgi:hypothetical protein